MSNSRLRNGTALHELVRLYQSWNDRAYRFDGWLCMPPRKDGCAGGGADRIATLLFNEANPAFVNRFYEHRRLRPFCLLLAKVWSGYSCPTGA